MAHSVDPGVWSTRKRLPLGEAKRALHSRNVSAVEVGTPGLDDQVLDPETR